jgi:polyisoprenoid-binding protein YceI
MKRVLSSIILLALGSAAVISQTTWKVDKANSQVNFSVSHLVISEVTGRFTDFDVTLVSSKDDFSDATINAVIKTSSINTDNETRDKDLRSDDFLNVEKFPAMTFKSKRIERAGEKTYKIAGDLTLRDSTKEVVLVTKYNGQITSGKITKAIFKATTTIDRFAFGTKYDSVIETGGMVVGRDVDITLLMELKKQTEEGKDK